MRIVSLVPSVTETLSAWDRTPVACTRFCERPDLPHVGGTKNPDVDAIAALGPDLVVMDEEENRRDDHDALASRGVPLHVLAVRSLDDVEEAMAGLSTRVDGRWTPLRLPAPVPTRQRAFVPIWRRPWMALGAPTYGASLLARLGTVAVPEGAGPYPRVDLEDVAAVRPDLVLAPNEPYPFGHRQLPELETVAPTRFVDGKDLFWWGIRTEGALARLGAELA